MPITREAILSSFALLSISSLLVKDVVPLLSLSLVSRYVVKNGTESNIKEWPTATNDGYNLTGNSIDGVVSSSGDLVQSETTLDLIASLLVGK